ncbi:MAG: thioredoxin family protein [Candidatus Methanomethylicia archaeon]|nr:thioredoxin family protein [Candidatus Methanomethylicia archaeon]
MVKVEFFTAEPPCAGCVDLLKIADEVAKKYGKKAEVVKHIGMCDEFQKYGITMVPAVVFEEGRIMLMGVCPDMETLDAAFRELGVQ